MDFHGFIESNLPCNSNTYWRVIFNATLINHATQSLLVEPSNHAFPLNHASSMLPYTSML